MTVEYSFIAFCSSILNSKTSRKAFLDPQKREALFLKFNLSPVQKKAAKSFDIAVISDEVKKEIGKAVKDYTKMHQTGLGW
jgi:hypothetical protein